MKKKITLCMVLSTFIICAMLCLTNCSNDDAPTSVFTPEAYNLYSAGYISIDAGRKIGRFRRDQRCGGDLLGKEQRAFHGRNAGKGHEVSGCRFHYFSGYFESQCILRKDTKALLQKSRAFFVL